MLPARSLDNRGVEAVSRAVPRRAPAFGRAAGAVNRAVILGLLALTIGGVYAIVVLGIGSIVSSTGRADDVLAVASTVVVAVSFQRARALAERFANRLVFGERMTPTQALTELSERVGATYATDDVLERVAKILAEGTGSVRAAVWLHLGETFVASADWPSGERGARAKVLADIMADRVVAVTHQGETLGALSVTKRAGDPLTANEARLVDDLAAQVSSVLRNVRLTAELQGRLEQIAQQAVELRASRARIVNAQDEERRRLERDIHDGAQQHLVALAVQLGLAKGLIAGSPEEAAQMLDALRGVTAEALETLRDLSRGIYPPSLAEGGIVSALRAHVGKGALSITIESSEDARYPVEVEAAVYFTCLEAIQNAAKYAGGTDVTVRLAATVDAIEFEIDDRGAGFDPATIERGSGLTNMTDRIEAIGGRLDVSSEVGIGTVIRGRVPADVIATSP